MNNHYSDKQVVAQVIPREEVPKYMVTGSTPYTSKGSESPQETSSVEHAMEGPVSHEKARPRKKRICGLPVTIFWVVMAVIAVVVVAGAVGGGVGGVLSSKIHRQETLAANLSSAKSTASSTQATPTSSATQVATTSSSSSLATTSEDSITSMSSAMPTSTIPTVLVSTSVTQDAQYTLLVDCPSSNWTVYTAPGTTQMFRKICHSHIFQLNKDDSTAFMVNQRTTNLDSCIQLCAAFNVDNASEIQAGSSSLCNAVCWRDTIEGNDWPGDCFGYTTTNSTGNFIVTDSSVCAGAALI